MHIYKTVTTFITLLAADLLLGTFCCCLWVACHLVMSKLVELSVIVAEAWTFLS